MDFEFTAWVVTLVTKIDNRRIVLKCHEGMSDAIWDRHHLGELGRKSTNTSRAEPDTQVTYFLCPGGTFA